MDRMELSLDVADRFIDGAIIIHVGIIGHDSIRHTMGEFVGDDIQRL